MRRKAKRKETQAIPFDEVFTFSNLWQARCKSVRGVGWKASVQTYRNHSLSELASAYTRLHVETFKSRGFYEFDIIERGKPRHIQSVHISERVVQRCLCDFGLVPAITPKLIYDNGACLKGKGIDFALDRLNVHLHRYYKEHGTNKGYVLVGDFSKYFENIEHDKLLVAMKKAVKDEKTMRLLTRLVSDFKGDKGLGLGSQISQVCAVYYPTQYDGLITNELGIRYYARYMDDSYLIHHSKDHLQKCLKAIVETATALGIKMNPKKTQISKLEHGFVWLKLHFYLREDGAVFRKPFKKSIVRMRRKLKIFKQWCNRGKLLYADVATAYMSWKGHISKSKTKKSVLFMDALYNKLFKENTGNGNLRTVPVCG